MNRIQISNISKQYKDIKALDHIYCTLKVAVSMAY